MSRSVIQDPIKLALADATRHWQVIDGSKLTADLQLACDVVIVGSGAGGGTAAEILTQAGLRVIIIEEGPFKSSSDFRMQEREAYPQLYQESAGRQTKDKAITILQGRAVGGSTTINWTSSFRTPAATLQYWQQHFGLSDYSPEKMAPWFARMEERLSIAPWQTAPNENNDLLRQGCEKLGLSHGAIRRNVKGCWNLGYCGMGCPTNAKQSMLVTTIPAALDQGAILIHSTRVDRLAHRHEKITSLIATGMAPGGAALGNYRVRVTARHYIMAGGAINTPAVLLRSKLPDPHNNLGRRTFLHPTTLSAALMKQRVEAFAGAPQTIYSDHFLETQPIDGAMGFKLEAPPLHPILVGITLQGYGDAQATWMKRLPNMQVVIALLRDGFHPDSVGGTVTLKNDGSPVLDYPISPFMWAGVRRSLHIMSEIQFAAGADIIMPLHEDSKPCRNLAEAKKLIDSLDLRPLRARVASAHVMGGCGMGADPRYSVISGKGQHHQMENLWVFDGSAFPTSIGANPQLSIYGMVARNASKLAGAM